VQDALADFATVVTYDRLGLGWRDPAPAPRGIDERVDDLRALLDAVEVGGPRSVRHGRGRQPLSAGRSEVLRALQRDPRRARRGPVPRAAAALADVVS